MSYRQKTLRTYSQDRIIVWKVLFRLPERKHDFQRLFVKAPLTEEGKRKAVRTVREKYPEANILTVLPKSKKYPW